VYVQVPTHYCGSLIRIHSARAQATCQGFVLLRCQLNFVRPFTASLLCVFNGNADSGPRLPSWQHKSGAGSLSIKTCRGMIPLSLFPSFRKLSEALSNLCPFPNYQQRFPHRCAVTPHVPSKFDILAARRNTPKAPVPCDHGSIATCNCFSRYTAAVFAITL
jgi:hypothetical protein